VERNLNRGISLTELGISNDVKGWTRTDLKMTYI
jgi:hypothetical protein